MYLKRRIDSQLLEWKNSSRRKPLLVRGARQIGKSKSIRNLGASFKYFIEVNFEERRELKTIFEQGFDIDLICERLSILYSTPVSDGETLLFLDEIQACPEALKALWFFKEKRPGLHVVGAGSLLEFALRDIPSYGVGRVSSIFMYPMCFDEFLWAMGKESWQKAISEASPSTPLFDTLHTDIVNLYRTFLLVGGMPAGVLAWIESGNYRECSNELADIQQTYYDDFSKYAAKIPPQLLRNTLQSVVAHTGGKFTFSKVAGGYATEEVKKALRLLSDAGLIIPVRHTAANGLPLGAEVNEKFTKYIYLDTGLLLRILDLDFGGADEVNRLIIAGTEEDLVNKGKLAEMSVGLEMLKAADSRHRYELYYWENLNKGATSEVDYVIPFKMRILPIEVKAGTSGKMKSLRLFIERKNLTRGIRTSLENFGELIVEDNGISRHIDIIPTYAISHLTENRGEYNP